MISGFFVAVSPALAAADPVSVFPVFVKPNELIRFTFTVTNTFSNPLVAIDITAPSGFTISMVSSRACPPNWTIDSSSNEGHLLCGTIVPANFLPVGISTTVSFYATSPDPLSDTEFSWAMQTTDQVWASGTGSTNTTVDVTPPITTDNTLANWAKNDVTVILTCSDGDLGSGCDKTYYTTDGSDPTTSSSRGNTVILTASGIYTIKYFSVDKVGNAELVKTAQVRIDKTAPVTTIVFGSPNSGTSTSPVYIKSNTQISLSATDGESGMGGTNYVIDGMSPPITYSEPFTILGIGPHPVAFGSVDAIGNQEVLQTISVFVDDTPPTVGQITISLFYQNGGTNYISGLSNISASVDDDGGSGVTGCKYTLDNGATWVVADYSGGICSINGAPTTGASSINIRATDNVGNVGEGTAVAVTPDTTAPSITNVIIAPVSPTGDNTPEISFTISDGGSGIKNDSVKISIGGPDYIPTCTGDFCSYAFSSPLSDGTYTFTISAGDNIGNSTSDNTSLIGYVIDTVKPTTSDNAPTGWQKTDVAITLTSADPILSSGLAWTKYCTGIADACNPTTDGTSYSTAVVVSDEGTTYFRYASADLAGNVENTVSRTVKIDKINPKTSAITSPLTDSYKKDIVTINASAEDNIGGSGIAMVEFYAQKSGETNIKIGENLDSSYSIGWDTTGLNGDYSLTAKAIDLAGNSIVSAPVVVHVDNMDPIVTINSVTTPTNINTQTITGTFTEINIVNIKVNNVTATMDGTTYSATIPLIEGPNAITAIATDKADRTGSAQTNVVLDTVAPVMQLITPADEAHIRGITEFVFDFNDASALQQLELDIVGPTPYNTPPSRIQATFPASVLTDPLDMARAASMGISFVYDASLQKWAISADTTKTWDASTYGPNPYGIPNGGKVYPDGTYDWYIQVNDAAGNHWGDMYNTAPETTRHWTFDNTAPEITLLGKNPVEIETGEAYVDDGATASDAIDGIVEVATSGSVNNTVGIYTLTYNAIDLAGNTAESKTRTINVVAPTLINLTASNVNQKEDLNFEASINSKGNVKDSAKDHLVRFYGVIPGLNSTDIVFSGSNIPEVVTNSAERGYAGASSGDLVLAWGPAGGFSIGANEVVYESATGLTSIFTAKIENPETYNVRFVFYDLTDSKVINGTNEGMAITILSDTTNLQMTSSPISVKQGEGFSTTVTTQGNVKDTELSNRIRFYGVIPGLNSTDIVFSGSNIPEVVTNSAERGYAGASSGDLVLAWGPAGGFSIGAYESLYETTGVPTQFDGNVTLTAPVGSHTVSFAVYDFTKSARSSAGSITLTITDGIAPKLTSVSIASNNENDSTFSLAKPGDIVTVTLVADENIQTPTVTIADRPAIVSGGNNSWSATQLMVSGDPEELITFMIDFADLAGNDGTTIITVTDFSSVTFDGTAPAVVITMGNGMKVNGNALITFDDDDQNPECSVDNKNWTDCISGETTFSNIFEFEGLPEGGEFTLYVRNTDKAGNIGTDDISLVKDTEAPSVTEGSLLPVKNAVGVALDAAISLAFSEKVSIDNVVVHNNTTSADVTIPGTAISFDNMTNTATVTLPAGTLQSNTVYIVTVNNIQDEAGNVIDSYGSDNSWRFTTATGYSISLVSGWNLISLPVTPATWRSIPNTLSTVEGKVNRIWTYDAPHGEWLVNNIDPFLPSDADFTFLEAGRGYWVEMKEAGTLTGSGTLYEQLVPSGDTPSTQLPQIQLAEGWNLIGYYQLPGYTNRPIENALSKLSGAWSGAGSDIIAFTPSTLQPLTPITIMNPGIGYWLYMDGAKKYSFGN